MCVFGVTENTLLGCCRYFPEYANNTKYFNNYLKKYSFLIGRHFKGQSKCILFQFIIFDKLFILKIFLIILIKSYKLINNRTLHRRMAIDSIENKKCK